MEKLRNSASGLIDRLPEGLSRKIRGLPPLVSPNNHLVNADFPWMEELVIAEKNRKAALTTKKTETKSSS